MVSRAAFGKRLGILLGLGCAALSAGAGAQAGHAPFELPPPSEVFVASRRYPLTTIASTNHSSWTESTANVNVPQTVRLVWRINRGGRAVLQARPAWNPDAAWKDLETFPGRNGRKGERALELSSPTLLRLRVKAPGFPRSGIARLEVHYVRRTIAALRGRPNGSRRPAIVTEGYDPFNVNDLNQVGRGRAPDFARLISEGKERERVDPWLLDWGDGAAPLQQQAEDSPRSRAGCGRGTAAGAAPPWWGSAWGPSAPATPSRRPRKRATTWA